MTKIANRQIDKSYEIYLSLYQAVSGNEEDRNIYKQFSRDFFDLVVIDGCHRSSAAEDSTWREILDYFLSATYIGLTATPKETKDVSNIFYFGEPIYAYSLKQGIDDGFLAPYKVVRIDIDKDVQGWHPNAGQTDKTGQEHVLFQSLKQIRCLFLTLMVTVIHLLTLSGLFLLKWINSPSARSEIGNVASSTTNQMN